MSKRSIVYIVEVDDDRMDEIAEYEPEAQDWLKQELSRQVDDCEYIGSFELDKKGVLTKLYNR